MVAKGLGRELKSPLFFSHERRVIVSGVFLELPNNTPEPNFYSSNTDLVLMGLAHFISNPELSWVRTINIQPCSWDVDQSYLNLMVGAIGGL